MFRRAPKGRFGHSRGTRLSRFSHLSGTVEDFILMKFGRETRNRSYDWVQKKELIKNPWTMSNRAQRARFGPSQATLLSRFSHLSGTVEDFILMKFGRETRNRSYDWVQKTELKKKSLEHVLPGNERPFRTLAYHTTLPFFPPFNYCWGFFSNEIWQADS